MVLINNYRGGQRLSVPATRMLAVNQAQLVILFVFFLYLRLIKMHFVPGALVHTCSLCILEAEAGGSFEPKSSKQAWATKLEPSLSRSRTELESILLSSGILDNVSAGVMCFCWSHT